MYRLTRFASGPVVVFLLLGWARGADEVKIVVPEELANEKQDGMAAWDLPPVHAQRVIDASRFIGNIPAGYLLTGFALRPDESVARDRKVVMADLETRLSTTEAKPNELNWTFADNLGEDVTLVYDGRWEGTLPGSGPVPRDFIEFSFLRPFAYDPSRGNLLFDFQVSAHSTVWDTDTSVAQVGSEVASQSGAHVATAEDEQGLLAVMQFTFAPPSGDYDLNGVLDALDIDALSVAVRTAPNDLAFDLSPDRLVDAADREAWVRTFRKTWFGDADLNEEFNSGDLVQVLAAGSYEVDVDSGWASGDFNGDGRTGSDDLIVALADGGYEIGPRPAAAVPEPTAGTLLGLGILLAVGRCRVGQRNV
jgi:hypothetical protein